MTMYVQLLLLINSLYIGWRFHSIACTYVRTYISQLLDFMVMSTPYTLYIMVHYKLLCPPTIEILSKVRI